MKQRLIPAALLFMILALIIVFDYKTGNAIASVVSILLIFCISTKECFSLLVKGAKNPSLKRKNAIIALCIIGIPSIAILALRLSENGGYLILYTLAVVQMTDNGGLLCGLLVGSHKLAPRLSPGKTLEGFIGGYIFAVCTGIILGEIMLSLNILVSISFGVIIASFSVLGDLSISYLKRRAQVKDSGKVLGGIGGILDLMDSMFASAPAALIFFRFMESYH